MDSVFKFLASALSEPTFPTINHLIKRIAVVLALALILFNLGIFFDGAIRIPSGPNILLLVIDTLRADHMSCYGYKRNTTPNLDRLAEESIVFTNAISPAPWTLHSMAGMFTSRYPKEIFVDDGWIIENKFLSLAEILREHNYTTHGIVPFNPIMNANIGFAQGFASYEQEPIINKGRAQISAPWLTNKAFAFLSKHRKDKFFLWMQHFDPHHEYVLHEPYNYYPDYTGALYSGQWRRELLKKAPSMSANDIKYLNALYDSEITYTDEFIGKLLAELKRLGLYDKTLIIVTADHGEEFCERGNHYIGHGATVYQEQVHVPLLVKMPGKNPHRVIQQYVGLINLMPTIVHYAGLEIPQRYAVDGETIDFQDSTRLPSKGIIDVADDPALQSIIWNGWKLIYHRKKNDKKLFKPADDPREINNIASQNETIVRNLSAALDTWNDEMQSRISPGPQRKVEFTRQERERLKALGYIQ